MNLYFAPMEGITGYVFRNTHREYFNEPCHYFTPFINPTESERKSIKELRDILPEKNNNKPVKVQILTNSASHFLSTEQKVSELGYDEININLGCPSNTVCKKGRGAGFIRDKEKLDNFLYEVFAKTALHITLKTRIGFSNIDEMYELMDIYNKYPIKELIIHSRTREQYYNGIPQLETFGNSLKAAKMPVCYNGNIYSNKDYKYITEKFKGISSVMIGRGAVMNPGIFGEITTGQNFTKERLTEFLMLLSQNYMEVLKSEHYTLGKLKEIMLYVMWMFPHDKKAIKGIKKATTIKDIFESLKCTSEIEMPSGL